MTEQSDDGNSHHSRTSSKVSEPIDAFIAAAAETTDISPISPCVMSMLNSTEYLVASAMDNWNLLAGKVEHAKDEFTP